MSQLEAPIDAQMNEVLRSLFSGSILRCAPSEYL